MFEKMATQTSDFTSSLSGEALEKAIRELKENPDTRQETLREFRRLIEEKEGKQSFVGVELTLISPPRPIMIPASNPLILFF